MNVGFTEILVILVIALLFFGPSRLPSLGKSIGEAIRGFKKGIDGIDESVNAPVSNSAPRQNQVTEAHQEVVTEPASTSGFNVEIHHENSTQKNKV